MMLDNKNEQKWPLTEKRSEEEQTVKGHFFCLAAAGGFSRVQIRQKIEERPKAAQHIYHTRYHPKCQSGFVQNCLNLRFAWIEIIHFVQHSVLKTGKRCAIL